MRRAGSGSSRQAMVVVGVCAAVALLSGCDPVQRPTSSAPSSAPFSSVAAAPATFAPVSPAPVSPASVPATTEGVVVTHVVDGDTFEISGGRTVRVLGIDSCEAGSAAGARASSQARSLLLGTSVTLRSEPGVDLDRYGRELRYVTTSTGDYGEAMVTADHTAVYAGRNDAAPSYVAVLNRLDSNGRVCSGPGPARDDAASGSSSSSSSSSGSHRSTPRPAVGSSSGSSGSSGSSAGSSAASSGGGSGYYKNCAAARAAGAAPLYAGQAGYRGALDRDGDGVACE